MRAFLFVVCLCIGGLALGQTVVPPRPPHGLVVIKLSLSRYVHQPRPGLPNQDDAAPIGRRDDVSQDAVDKMRGPSAAPSPSAGLGKTTYDYFYSLKIRNEGDKTVRGVLWEYVASDLDSGAELNRRRFTNLEEIAAGKTATLSGTSSLPPTSIVTSGGLGKNGESPYKSSADIKCVLYDDGTEWAAGGAKDCDELRKAHDDARGRKTKR